MSRVKFFRDLLLLALKNSEAFLFTIEKIQKISKKIDKNYLIDFKRSIQHFPQT